MTEPVPTAARPSFVGVVIELAQSAGPEGLTLGEVMDRLDERAFGIAILILAVPCLVPALYGVPQIVGVPILLLALQLLAGREEPWLPASWLRRRISKEWLDRMGVFAEKRMGWFERLSRPRLSWLTAGFGEKLIGIFMILATLTIVLPMTNTVPSVALALLAVALIERDGLFAALGMLIAAGWVGFLATLAFALIFGAAWAVSLIDRVGASGILDQLGKLFGA
ncbi:MAG TPA: exopolysaccharide biosynthesis protein [Caulobacteraceae bacterium]|nr:exopolysaccharide biosynthesis protein [Caulobacteraceae bacterium]